MVILSMQGKSDLSSEDCFKMMAPLVNKLLLPKTAVRSSTMPAKENETESKQMQTSCNRRNYFTPMDDNLLLIGL